MSPYLLEQAGLETSSTPERQPERKDWSMTRLSRPRHRQQQALLAACTTSHRAPSWPGRPVADDAISFADIRRLPEPEWADTVSTNRFWPGRYAVGALVPAGQLASVPLPTVPERVLDDIAVVTADVAAVFAARPELRHNTALLMALAPVVAQLKGLVA